MTFTPQLTINGRQVDATSGKTFDNIDPYLETVIGR